MQTENWRDYDAGPIVWTRSFTYNENNQILTAADNNGTYTFTFDELNRIATVQDVWGITLTNTWDAGDRLTRVTDTKGGQRDYEYDDANRNTVRKFSATGQAARLDLVYNDRDEVTQVKRYTDLAGTTLVGKTIITIDDAHRLTRIDHQNAGGTTLDAFNYQFDNDDKLTQETSTLGPTRNYTYDGDDQLLSDGTNTWTFDLAGNRTNAGYVIGSANRLTSDGTWNYTYDSEGNVTQKVHATTTETWVYWYNQLNQLTKAEHNPTSADPVDKRVEFKYDIFGNRIEKSYDADGDGAGTATITKFAYEGSNAWADLDSANNLQKRRLYLPAVDALFARMGSSGEEEWYLTDRLGSVRDIMNNSGTILDHIDYNGFGLITNETNPSNGDRYKFTGREFDSELPNLAYYRARYYQLDVGRFLNEDPIRFAAGDSNLFRYVGNNPTNATDPTGLDIIPLDMTYGQFQQMYHAYYQQQYPNGYVPPPQAQSPIYSGCGAYLNGGFYNRGTCFLEGLGSVASFGSGLIDGAVSVLGDVVGGIWHAITNPGETFNTVVGFVGEMLDLIRNADFIGFIRQFLPLEVIDLIRNWSNLSMYDRGYQVGRILGQSGVAIITSATMRPILERVRWFRQH